MAENLVNSVKKALNALDILLFEDSERKGISLSKLSKQTGLRPNTLHNILKTMVHCGYVEQKENSSYFAGEKCSQIGRSNQLREMLADKIQPILKKTCKKLNEGIVFYTLLDGGKAPLLSLQNNEIITIDYSRYDEVDFFSKVTGRVLAAFASKKELDRIINRWGFPGKNWNNIDNNESLERELAAIREKGHAILVENNSIISIAAPVTTNNGELFGTIGCFAPLFRCDDKKQEQIIQEVVNSCAEMSSLLQAQP